MSIYHLLFAATPAKALLSTKYPFHLPLKKNQSMRHSRSLPQINPSEGVGGRGAWGEGVDMAALTRGILKLYSYSFCSNFPCRSLFLAKSLFSWEKSFQGQCIFCGLLAVHDFFFILRPPPHPHNFSNGL